MTAVQIDQLCFTYPNTKNPAISNVSLQIEQGELLLIFGHNGSGKSTLARHLKPEIIPFGTRSGTVRTDGETAFVFQNPELQIVMENVYNELTFSMENAGLDVDTMRKRVADVVHFFGISDLLYKKTDALSGGEKQLVNLAAAVMLRPQILILDEPVGQLDPMNSRRFAGIVKRINEELMMTVVIVEQNVDAFIDIADRLLMMRDGLVQHYGTPSEVLTAVWNSDNEDDKLFIPHVPKSFLQWYYGQNMHEKKTVVSPLPFHNKALRQMRQTVMLDEGDRVVSSGNANTTDPLQTLSTEKQPRAHLFTNGTPFIQAKNIMFTYSQEEKMVLSGLSVDIFRGEIFSIVGGNGAGKSTLLKLFAGILKPYAGKLRFASPAIGYLCQNPMLYFTCDTVREEIYFLEKTVRKQKHDYATRAQEMIGLFGLQHLLDRHPYDLSGGEQQKAALASVLMRNVDLLILDEPARGLDPISKDVLAKLLLKVSGMGITIIVVSHDMTFMLKCADRCAMLFDGTFSTVLPAVPFFQNHYFYGGEA